MPPLTATTPLVCVKLCGCQTEVLSVLTWVEVFGFGQLNGGTSFFLQLYDGLAPLANYRACRIAGDQHLQEVLALLWGLDTQSGKGHIM